MMPLRELRCLVAVVALLAGCEGSRYARALATPAADASAASGSVATIEPLLRADDTLAAFIDDAERHRFEVFVSVVTTNGEQRPTLARSAFREDAEYFYPASAVKLPVAVVAAEKLADLRAASPESELGLDTRVRFGGGSARTVTTTLRAEMEKALIFSDNDAHNRLFAFVGANEVAERLDRMGFKSPRITRRIADSSTAPTVIELLPAAGGPLTVMQRVDFPLPPSLATASTRLGDAYVDEGGRLVRAPMDFATKNAISLRDLQDILVALVRPDLASGPTPRLDAPDRDALLEILGRLPSERSEHGPTSARGRLLDETLKPLHVALARALPSDKLSIIGKGGRAYGFIVENLYASDDTTGRAMFVTATIYANDNATLNDDRYEYESVASPVLRSLGELLARQLLAGS